MLIDTHCHLAMMGRTTPAAALLTEQEIPQIKAIIQEAAEKDVAYIVDVGTSVLESINCVFTAAHLHNVYASVGIHPNDGTAHWKEEVADIEKLLQNNNNKNKIIAVGECGIDTHYPSYNLDRQKDLFKAQIELALKYQKALIVHTRDAPEETLRILESYRSDLRRCVIHCFSGDFSFAQTIISWGYYMGIGGTITYPKNATLRAIVTQCGIAHVVLETDAPFLPPQNMRGKRNHPAQVATIAHYLAELLSIPFERVAEQTTHNAAKLFGLCPRTV